MPEDRFAPPTGARLWPLDGPRADIVEAIVTGLAALRSAIPRGSALPADIDLVAGATDEGAVIAETTQVLVMALMDDVMAGDDRPALAGPLAFGELPDLAKASASFPMSAAQRRDALGDASAIIREVGLERYDLDCYLGSDRDGRDVIAGVPIAPATAHVWLLDRLFQRAEVFVLNDEVLIRERMASAWYFSRWSVAGRGWARDSLDFTRRVREQEWSLVERETATLEVPVIEALGADEGFARIPSRQQRLARALAASIVDVFVVESVEGNRVLLRSARDGHAYRVHEHADEVRVQPGFLVIGRLIPFEHDLWLRSPGTVSFPPRRPDDAAVFADTLTKVAGAMPFPIALEALISTVVLGGKPPLSPKPAPSAREAGELVQFMTDALERLGLREEVPIGEMPDDVVARLQRPESELHYYRFAVDEALAEWMTALTAQAERGEPAASGGGHGRGGKKGKKKRRR